MSAATHVLLEQLTGAKQRSTAAVSSNGKRRLQAQLDQISVPVVTFCRPPTACLTDVKTPPFNSPRPTSIYQRARKESIGALQLMGEMPLAAIVPTGAAAAKQRRCSTATSSDANIVISPPRRTSHGTLVHELSTVTAHHARRGEQEASQYLRITEDVLAQSFRELRVARASLPPTTTTIPPERSQRCRFDLELQLAHRAALARVRAGVAETSSPSHQHHHHYPHYDQPELCPHIRTSLASIEAESQTVVVEDQPKTLDHPTHHSPHRRHSLVDGRGHRPDDDADDVTPLPTRPRHVSPHATRQPTPATNLVSLELAQAYFWTLADVSIDSTQPLTLTGREVVTQDMFSRVFQHVLGFQDTLWATKCFAPSLPSRRATCLTLLELQAKVHMLRHGTDADKMQFVFSIYDVDRSGTVEVDEVFETLQSDKEDMWDQVMFSQLLLGLVNPHHDGIIEFDEFCTACRKIPMFFTCFTGALPLRLSSQPDNVKYRLRLESIRTMWSYGVKESAMETAHAISVDAFKTIISYFFRFSKASAIDQALATRIFQTFAQTSNRSIQFDEFIRGLFTLLEGAVEPRGRLMHSILDLDRGGTVTKSEIDMILRSRARTLQLQNIKDLNLERNAMEIMKVLDANGDGDISVEEFMAAVRKGPHVLEDLLDILFSGCHLEGIFNPDACKQHKLRNADIRDPDFVVHPHKLRKDFKKVFSNAVKKVSAVTVWCRSNVALQPSTSKANFKPIEPT
ncbi:Aste57867_1180 [Aphanomyces stellatus]|uniref:Aste57867_1180 protein n=1 Tax=Aphanomyces stellatus TaxID=120398 RepID=A0A485K7X2_9STRA|nr:hypothetical protein As57867_001179 [Aphanomyces stellatus]VFT78400.1 Aste57867_1180 [Aphanomyces stellatus]